MTKTKSTKRALLMSALSLLMCVSMLIGSTFAWFTDSVTSGRNIIQSGNLDAKLSFSTWDKETNTWGDYQEVTSDTVVFGKDAKYEPGYTEVVKFKVENLGSLAFKYQLGMHVFKETPSTNVYGDEFYLSDYIKVGSADYVPSITDRASAVEYATKDIAEATNLAVVMSPWGTELTCILEPAGSFSNDVPQDMAEWVFVIHMPTTVGNEANHKSDVEAPSIEFAVNLIATQYTYENDSFDNQYDKDAEYPVIDAEGLADAIAEGKDVKLEADVALTETIAVDGDIAINLNGFNLDASDNTSRPFELADGATLAINGGDEEVDCGAYGLVNIPAGNDATVILNGGKYMAETDSGSFIKPRGDGEITIVLKDVEYIDSSANGYALDCTAYTGDDLNVVIEDCKFEATVGLILPEGASVKGTEITVNNTKNMQPAVYATGDMTIENCIIKAAKSHAVAVAGGATLTVKNCEVYAGTDANALAFQVFSSGGTIDVYETTYVGEIGTTGKMNTGRVAIINIDGVEAYRKG